jgi:hypothetical protein
MRQFSDLEMEMMSVEELDVHLNEVRQRPDASPTYLDRVQHWRSERNYQDFLEDEAAEAAEVAAESLSAMLINPPVNWRREGF